MKTILGLLFIAITSLSYSQSIADDIGAVSCDFKIMSSGIDLGVKKQLLIQRAETVYKVSDYENQSYGAGLAYTEWHLEFVVTNKVQSRKKTFEEGRRQRRKFDVQFKDKNGNLISQHYISSSALRFWEGGTIDNPMYTYSMNLLLVPMIAFDDAAFLEVVLIE